MQTSEKRTQIERATARASCNENFKKEIFENPNMSLQVGTLFFNDNVPVAVRAKLLELARTSEPEGYLSNFGRIVYQQKMYIWTILNRHNQSIEIYKKENSL